METDIPILYEDEELVVVNKPAGIVVNIASTVKETTVQDWSRDRYFRNQSASDTSDFYLRHGIVHRLDKETSGVLIVAKKPDTFAMLQAQFKARTVKKTYVALVHGIVVPEIGEVEVPVGRLPWNRERFGVVAEGKPSKTRFHVLETFTKTIHKQAETFSFVEFFPETGRTHQIRVHAKYIGHPLVSDYHYAGRKTYRRDSAWAPRLMLHAKSITFTHPATGGQLTVTAPVPEDISRVLSVLSEK